MIFQYSRLRNLLGWSLINKILRLWDPFFFRFPLEWWKSNTVQLLFVKFLALPAPQDAGSVFPGPDDPILDGNSDDGYSPSIYAGPGHDNADAEMPAQPVWDQKQLVLADPKPEFDDDLPLAALLEVSCEQPVAFLNDGDVVMSPGPHDPGATSASSSSTSSSLDDLQPPEEHASKADADPGPPPPEPVQSGVRPGAKAAAAKANPLHPPAAPRHHVLFWEDVTCPDCNTICGQYKFSPGPGRREGSDPPTWIIRVKEEDGSWPSKGRCFHRRVAHLVSEECPKRWISENKRCCRR